MGSSRFLIGYYYFIVAVSVACVWSGSIPVGLEPQAAGRIVGGVKSSINTYPWQISLQRSGAHFCGGSVYSSNIIITAAHCLQSISSASVLRVRAGSSYWNSGGDLLPVAAFRLHEGFDAKSVSNDIAVVRLSSTLKFSPLINSINLAVSSPSNGAPAYVSGWGLSSYSTTSSSNELQSVQLKIVSQTSCSAANFSYRHLIKPSMICAYAINKDACKGDSGGPLVSGGNLVGVVSWGVKCAVKNYPGVYTDVAVMRPWIVNAAKTL